MIRPRAVSASSTHAAGAGYTFDAANAVDGDLSTSWQPAARGQAWVRVDFDHDITITGVAIANGFQARDRHGDEFTLNSRIARGRLRFSDRSELPIALNAGTRGLVRIPVDRKRTRSVTVLVDEVHRGSRWDDLAVSEVQVRGWAAADEAEEAEAEPGL